MEQKYIIQIYRGGVSIEYAVRGSHVGSIGSRGEPEPVGEPAMIADGNIAAMLNAPPCGVHVTGGRLD